MQHNLRVLSHVAVVEQAVEQTIMLVSDLRHHDT